MSGDKICFETEHPGVPLLGALHRYPSLIARLSICALALMAGLQVLTERLHAQPTGGPALTLVSGPYYFDLFVSGPQSTNFVLETSPDLKSWTNLFQLFGRPGSNAVCSAVRTLQGPAQGFWRALPGEPLLIQEQRWTNHEPVEYSFRFRHMISFWAGGVRGTVRVLNRVVVEVTDAIDDRTLQPIPNPDLSQFLTITQLFEQIGQEFEAASEAVRVRYDPGGLYPEYISVDRIIRAADDESEFEVSQFTVLQP